MNNLRDYYERVLQEFGTSDDGEFKSGAGMSRKSVGCSCSLAVQPRSSDI